MEKLFVPKAQSLQLKALGFDEPCLGRHYYKESYPMLNPQSEETELVFEFGQYIKQTDVTILAPTFSQAFRFFREKYKLHIEIRSYTARFFTIVIQECKDIVKYIEYGGINLKFNTYEEAELACLEKLIEIVKTK